MPKTYVVPTHLRMPETVLAVGGLLLSARQFLTLLIGAATGYDLWLNLQGLASLPIGAVVRLVIASFPLLVASSLAFVRLSGRDLPGWLVVWIVYRVRPHTLVWRSVRFLEPSLVLDGTAGAEETQKDEHDG